MLKETIKGKSYLVPWEDNPCYCKEDLQTLISENVVRKVNGVYYTEVIAHYTGEWIVVDCTCNLTNGDYYPLDVSCLIDLPVE